MRVFIDTEFIDDGRTIDLISIGMVAEDGREYYAISNEFDMKKFTASKWLVDNVLPGLPNTYSDDEFDLGHPSVMPRKTIAKQVAEFLYCQPGLELWAYYGAYDHVALAQLFGPMINLPSWIPMFTRDIKQLACDLGSPELPKQAKGHHNALEDARHNKVMFEFLQSLKAKK